MPRPHAYTIGQSLLWNAAFDKPLPVEVTWLAGWSLADDAVPHPLDPIAVAEAIARLARTRVAAG